jgi:hypothetical protein
MTTGEIPQSNALAEASADSLAELLNRDPEGYSLQDRGRIVAAYRDLRAKMERSTAEAATAGPKPRKASAKGPATTVAAASAEDLDL